MACIAIATRLLLMLSKRKRRLVSTIQRIIWYLFLERIKLRDICFETKIEADKSLLSSLLRVVYFKAFFRIICKGTFFCVHAQTFCGFSERIVFRARHTIKAILWALITIFLSEKISRYLEAHEKTTTFANNL